MSTLMINDLSMGKELDRAALANFTGRGDHWQLISRSYGFGAWSSYQLRSKSYVATRKLHGKRHRLYKEKWVRTRVQYEYTKWYHWQPA